MEYDSEDEKKKYEAAGMNLREEISVKDEDEYESWQWRR